MWDLVVSDSSSWSELVLKLKAKICIIF